MAFLPIRVPTDLQRLALNTTREDHWLEFKREPHARSDQGRVELARDVAQFANASGGVLVIGADEVVHVLSGWQTVPNPDDFIHWADDVVKGHLAPVPSIEPHVLQVPSDETVVALNVPPSLPLIARRQGDGFEFPIRAGDSRRYMTLIEVEARMQNDERLARLRLEQIGEGDSVTLDGQTRGISERGWKVTGVDDHVVSLATGALHVDVPLAYVQAVYRTREPDAAWVVALSARIERIGAGSGAPEHLLVRKI
jgi:hypothetical protein